jgi:hypothetical protein
MPTSSSTLNAFDVQLISWRTADLMTKLGANDSAEAQAALANSASRQDYLQLSKQVGNMMASKAEYDAAFQKNTDVLALMNESWNANRYIVNALGTESKRVNKLDSQAKRDIYKLRQENMFYTYKTAYYAFGTRVIILTLYATLLALIPASMWRSGTIRTTLLIIIILVLLAVYAIVMFLSFAGAANRRKDDWTKVYWRAGDAVSAATNNDNMSCSG